MRITTEFNPGVKHLELGQRLTAFVWIYIVSVAVFAVVSGLLSLLVE